MSRALARVIYSSPFVPAEWIAAHGLSPRRETVMGDAPSALIPDEAGVCPYMRGFLSRAVEVPGVSAVVLATGCDQMRRGFDFLRKSKAPSFLMNLPSATRTPVARKLYRRELERLGGFLASLGGVRPTREALVSTMLEYERRRMAPRKGRGRRRGKAIPIGLVGGPLTSRHSDLLDAFARHGAEVVLDGTETGLRTRPARFDRRRLEDDPLGALAEAYLEAIPDIFERPNDAIFSWVEKSMEAAGARGVVLIRYLWCDKWHAEVHRFRERLRVPLLDLELDQTRLGERTKNRIQAFLEALR